MKLGGSSKGAGGTCPSLVSKMVSKVDGVLLRPQLPCISRVLKEQLSLGPIASLGFGAGFQPTCPPLLPVTDNPDYPSCSLRNVSHPRIHLCSQLCPAVPRKCHLCARKRGAECAPPWCLLTCLGQGGGNGRPWSPFGTSFYGHRLLTSPWQVCSNPGLARSLLSFADPVCNPGGRAGRVEKFSPMALPGACTAQGLVPPPLSPPSSGTTRSLLFTSWA